MYIKLKNKTDSNRVGGRYIVGQQKLFNDLSNSNVWCLDLESELKKVCCSVSFSENQQNDTELSKKCLKIFKKYIDVFKLFQMRSNSKMLKLSSNVKKLFGFFFHYRHLTVRQTKPFISIFSNNLKLSQKKRR